MVRMSVSSCKGQLAYKVYIMTSSELKYIPLFIFKSFFQSRWKCLFFALFVTLYHKLNFNFQRSSAGSGRIFLFSQKKHSAAGCKINNLCCPTEHFRYTRWVFVIQSLWKDPPDKIRPVVVIKIKISRARMWACLTFQKSTKIVNRKISEFFYLQSFTAETIIM